jgi:hypothetical protein
VRRGVANDCHATGLFLDLPPEGRFRPAFAANEWGAKPGKTLLQDFSPQPAKKNEIGRHDHRLWIQGGSLAGRLEGPRHRIILFNSLTTGLDQLRFVLN